MTDLAIVACQLGDCRNQAALSVTIELPTSWTESREYTVHTLLVAVCGECAPLLETDARALLEARSAYARRLDRRQTTPHRRPVLVPASEPAPGAPSPPSGRRPRGGDDAA